MPLSEEQIKNLLEWFVTSSEAKKKWSEPRKKALEEYHQWIQPERIKQMPDDELKDKFLEYYQSGGGRQTFNQIYRDRIIRDINRFRQTLLFLLDEKIDIRERINRIVKGGDHYIEGMGKALLSSFLMDYNPDKYCLWNSETEMGLSVLGWRVYERGASWGDIYLRVLDALKRLKEVKPEFNLTFDDIDLFLHTISAENEGQEAVRRVSEGVIFEPLQKETQPTPAGKLEFTLESHLEEFIETNFSRINFGANLELYQDEENTGRQYQTPLGKIDLLAIDKENKQFVVIELKKGVSSDVVVGQILRYMGWVKENLRKDYKDYTVRGIIIAKEKDEKLEYALKMTPDVNLFIYKVSFDIERIV